jgi:hypothetical protein
VGDVMVTEGGVLSTSSMYRRISPAVALIALSSPSAVKKPIEGQLRSFSVSMQSVM